MEQRFTFTNPNPQGVRGLRVLFVPTRTTIERCNVALPEDASLQGVDRDGLAVDVHWDKQIPGGGSVTLSLGVSGEPLVKAQTRWRAGDGALLSAGDAPAPSPVAEAAEGALNYAAFAKAMLHARCKSVREHPNHRVARYGGFFCDLDLHTNPSLFHEVLTGQEFDDLFVIVRSCELLLQARMDERRQGGAATSSISSHSLTKDEIAHISQLIIDFYTKGLNVGDARIDADELWTAFEMFANGELRTTPTPDFDWNCEPNSAALFFFAEFGFLAVELGIHVPEWELILPNHVAIQEIFARAYRPDDGALTFTNYVPENFSTTKQVGPKFKAEMRVKYWVMRVEELEAAARDNLRAFLADQP